ncbi:aminotransferase class I/II-fold pyridoxal phosphate-dependent enzyme, partial [Testudinibacter aquarius]
TALSPLLAQWVYFLMQRLPEMQMQRQHLQQLSSELQRGVEQLTQQPSPSRSQIVPYILGDNASTLSTAERLQQCGFYCLPIRPPTVPSGTSRIRFSLTADMATDEVAQLLDVLKGSQ